jgi:hypothetical protein
MSNASVTTNQPLNRLAVALATIAIAQIIIMQAAGAHGPIWITQGIVAAVTATVAWRAGAATPNNTPARIAFAVGTILFLAFIGFAIAHA